MHDFFLGINNPSYINLFYFALIVALFHFLAIKLWTHKLKKKVQYDGIQKIHEGDIPRLGGLIIVVSLLIFSCLTESYQIAHKLRLLIIASTPIIFIIFLEDIKQNVPTGLRFLAQLLTAILVIVWLPSNLPTVDFFLLDQLFQIDLVRYGFFIVCLVALMNGMNFIDGANGLMPAFFLSSLLNIGFLTYHLNGDTLLSALSIIFFIPAAIFLLFNYPLGKIFSGDLGAYLKGLLLGYLVINLFASQQNASLWSALIILFYPTAELIFSCWRKIIRGKSPLKPDRLHLHIKLYDLIYKATQKSRLANNLVVVFLSFFWLMPMLILPWVYDDTALVILTLVILSSMYLLLNHYIPETKPIEHKQRSMGRGAKAINKAG